MNGGTGEPLIRVRPAQLQVSVRLETPGDVPGVRAVELAAFAGPEEADIVDRIRAERPEGWQSLVAIDGADEVLGHLLLTPCPVEDADGRVLAIVLAIGPMAVRPTIQLRGVGSALMTAALGLAVARAAPALVLLGYPEYYGRFGFEPARAVGLEPPAAAWPDEAWMARRLPAWDEAMAGTVRYPEAFGPLS